MKRIWIITAIISLAFLSACGGAQEATENPQVSQTEEAAQPQAEEDKTRTDDAALQRFQVSDQANLIMGTFMLEETELAVTPEQASDLAFLWKAVRSLAESDSATQEERQALINQIQDTMTEEQLEAMQTQDFSMEEYRALMDELGLSMNQMQENAESEIPEGAGQGRPEGMQPGMGGGPGGGMGGGQIGDIDPEVMATLQAERAGRTGGGDRMSLLMLDPLIELLEERAQG